LLACRALLGCSVTNPRIELFEDAVWPALAAGRIQSEVALVLAKRGRCSVMLTGGRSAARLYEAWSGLPAFNQSSGVDFYFGDERCVAPDSVESNYGLAMKTLFCKGVPKGCKVFRMEGDGADRELAARRYDKSLPRHMDMLLLGVGNDGHVASLFPRSPALKEHGRSVMPVVGPKAPHERLTITPPVISGAKRIFVLATGGVKAEVLAAALRDKDDIESLPVRLALRGTWLVDTALSEANN
jgi:6-phosphogluconolactonase